MAEISYTLIFYQDKANEWRWQLKHSNGQIVAASSEGFSSEAECKLNARRTRDGLHLVTAAWGDEDYVALDPVAVQRGR